MSRGDGGGGLKTNAFGHQHDQKQRTVVRNAAEGVVMTTWFLSHG
jgi:hypothetical protein